MACPYMAAALPAGGGTESDGDVSKCPMHAIQSEKQQQPAAVCPLGFGSTRGPKLSTLHCPVCKGLLFEPHMVDCKHTFCLACISKTKHYGCPVCGQDVADMQPNKELSDLVDTFLNTHSKSPQLVAAQADLGPLPDSTPASFFMAQGLKSLSGGNVHAAIHRLGRCREELLETSNSTQQQLRTSTAAAGDVVDDAISVQTGNSNKQSAEQLQQQRSLQNGTASSSAAIACQLTAVCGSLGDCYQRLGDSAQAEQLYKESVAAAKPHAETDAEAAHAVSVSLNKLGDMKYTQGQLQDAKRLYKQAMDLRQMVCGQLTKGEAGPEQQLELAVSLIKVADVSKALQDTEEADKLLHRAQGVCLDAQHMADTLPAHVNRKLQMLLDVLHVQDTSARAVPAAAAGQRE